MKPSIRPAPWGCPASKTPTIFPTKADLMVVGRLTAARRWRTSSISSSGENPLHPVPSASAHAVKLNCSLPPAVASSRAMPDEATARSAPRTCIRSGTVIWLFRTCELTRMV